MAPFIFKLLYSQLIARLPVPTSSFTNQTVIITGSNTGLGLEAARHIVSLGAAKVILAVRTLSKGEAAAENILRTTQSTKDIIEVWPLDLSNYESVKAFGARVMKLDRLDAVIQNAGILTEHFSLAEGDESHITVNVISSMLVALLTLPKLRESASKFSGPTRLSLIGSDLFYTANPKDLETSGSILDKLRDKEEANMSGRRVYSSP
jgi:NAD(P)-dependent dehydrogenase (short-subunit alcohol dehydrogenase family)